MPRKVQHEQSEQENLVNWFKLAYPDEMLACIPNQLIRGCVQARRMIMSGLIPGLPDLMLLKPIEPWAGLFIELKRPTVKGQPKGVVSPRQESVMAHLSSRGYKVALCFGWDAAKLEITKYLGPRYERK